MGFKSVIQDKINERILKFPEKKEVVMIDEDLRTLINSKKARGITPNPNIRKVWIPKQYLIYNNELIGERRVPGVRENKKNRGNPNHSSGKNAMWFGHEATNERFSKENNVSPKKRHAFPREKGMNDPSRRKMSQRFIIPSIVSPRQEWPVV